MRHRNAGALLDHPASVGHPRFLQQYRRAGIVIPEEWTVVDLDGDQLAALRMDPHVEMKSIAAELTAETETA